MKRKLRKARERNEWTPELRATVDRGLALWPKKHPTPLNQPIILAKGRHAFKGDGLFQAFAAAQDAAIEAGELAESFTHDIRTKSASDTDGLEAASARLGRRAHIRLSACTYGSLRRSRRLDNFPGFPFIPSCLDLAGI